MDRIFSTSEVHPRDRFDYWHGVACKNLVPHDSEPECRHTFRAEMHGWGLADLGLILFENSTMRVLHTNRHCARMQTDELFVCRLISGQLALEQAGRQVTLEAGDLTLLDPRLPYEGRFASGAKSLVLRVPRRALEARVGKTTPMLLSAMTLTEAQHRLTSSYLAMLPDSVGGLSPATVEMVKAQALDLIALSLAKTQEKPRPYLTSAKAAALMNVRAAIEARLCDPRLDAEMVAAAAGVSIRYANALLAREGTTISRLIQSRRLARCRTALTDPQQGNRTITEIASGWGFSDMTHFGRRFKMAYGVLPKEFRQSLKQHRS